jgi:myb proto-oncogene protein
MGKKWVEIAKHFPGRTGKQIRERYLNKLDPELKFENWTKQEDEIILSIFK